MADKYGVQGYPTLKFFGAGSGSSKEPVDFDARELEEMVDLINQKAGTFRTSEGLLFETAGRLTELDVIIEEAAGKITDAVVKALSDAASKLDSKSNGFAEQYVNVAKKIIAKGNSYVDFETKRSEQMIKSDAITSIKKTGFMIKRNILAAFAH